MERGLVLGEGSQAAELVVIFFFFCLVQAVEWRR